MKKLLLILVTILVAISAQAQQETRSGETKYKKITTNSIVTISRNNNGRTYFTVENNAIVTHNEPNINSLWKVVYCAYQRFDWGDQNIYQLRHLNTGKYLRVDAQGTGNRATLRFSLSDNNESYSTICQNNPGNPGNNVDGL